jgi:hypothetical protein
MCRNSFMDFKGVVNSTNPVCPAIWAVIPSNAGTVSAIGVNGRLFLAADYPNESATLYAYSGTMTNVATIHVSTNVMQIISQPISQVICTGATAQFSVAAVGDSLKYQWRLGGFNLADGGDISGATTATLRVSSDGFGPRLCGSVLGSASTGMVFLSVVGGATYKFEATGSITYDGGGNCADADGYRWHPGYTITNPPYAAGSGFTCPGLNALSLVGKVGTNQVQLGTSGTFTAPESGTLTLYFNDNIYSDNSNFYSVCISPPAIGDVIDVIVTSDCGSEISSNATIALDTVCDGIPDWWRAQYFGGDGTTTNSSSCASCDPDNDFLSNLGEYLNGTSPTNNDGSPAPSFIIDAGAEVVTNGQLQLGFPGLAADSVLISESITMANAVTNQFVTQVTYTLTDTNDGVHTVYVQLLKTNGTTSSVLGRSFQLDQTPPTLTISSPTNGGTTAHRRVVITGFASDATNSLTQYDPRLPLRVTVNGDFVNDRDTNGVWLAGPEDLVPGTNTFVAVATDRAGFSVSNSVLVIYDPTLATNVPVFTVDVTNTITVASNTTTIALSGTIDDDNATIQIAMVDSLDNTITNAVVPAAVHGTSWWGEVPVVPGSNLVIITAQDAGSLPATNTFIAIQDPNTFLEITSPMAGSDVNDTNVLVVGVASTNFDGTITINGQAALVSTGPDGITFSNTVPINNIDANIIEVQATGLDGSSATMREIVYGYEVLRVYQFERDDWTHTSDDCWYAQHYPDDHEYRNEGELVPWDWDALDKVNWDSDWAKFYSLSGRIVNSWNWSYPESISYLPPSEVCWVDTGWMDAEFLTLGRHLDGGQTDFYNCPWGSNCVCQVPPYCIGEVTSNCCVDAVQEQGKTHEYYPSEMTFIKHWPTDEEQTVVLHFTGLAYFLWTVAWYQQDTSKMFLWGQPAFEYSTDAWRSTCPKNIGFVVRIKTNTRYTLRDTDFVVPTMDGIDTGHWPNSQSTYVNHIHGHFFWHWGFGNVKIGLDSDPKPNLGISAKSAWPDQEAATRTATITVKVTPPEDADKVKDRITLEVKELQGNPSYTPTGMGTLTQDTSNKLKWTYEAFEEPQSAKHPEYKSAVIVAKLDGKDVVATMNLTVHPVFRWLANVAQHQHGPGGAMHRPPVNADYEQAWRYVTWKYNFIDPDVFNSVQYGGANPSGIRAQTSLLNNCTLYQGAFDYENKCASTLGHEAVHTIQDLEQRTIHCNKFYRHPDNCEVPAYQWEIDYAQDTGIPDWFRDQILVPCRDYYSGASNSPCGEGD